MGTTFVFVFVLFVAVHAQYYYRTEYINVPLDHFTFTDNRTFPLRYLINDTYWKPGHAPIFFYTGNEGDVEDFARNTGFLWESAIKYNALVVFAEHRYYGASMPFGNSSLSDPKYFGYLSSQQALADFVDVISYIRNNSSYSTKKVSPVIAFGGSYGGMLSAWIRMKYPAVVEGALASSAPIWEFTGLAPCDSFNRILTSIFNSTSKYCSQNIRQSWQTLDDLAKNDDGKSWISSNWKLCKPLKTQDDIQTLKDWISGAYGIIGMSNYPYETSFMIPKLPAHPVKVMCSSLKNSSLSGKELLTALFQTISVYFNSSGTATCLDWSTDSTQGLGMDAWNIQSCTEMVMPQCSNGVTDMFEPTPWNITDFDKTCFNQFKIHPLQYYVEKEYGGKDIRTASNIIFSNGLLDPWSGGGVLKNVSPTTAVVIIPNAAHHLDLRASNVNDPPDVVNARILYRNIFDQWIRKYHKKDN